jgi:two-component system phosphate regulon response regulator PhoB
MKLRASLAGLFQDRDRGRIETLEVNPSPRVLIVEDDAEIAQLLQVSLGRAGFRVRAVATAGDAILAAQSFRPQVMLLDLRLPDGSGYDVCRVLMAEHATRSIAVIIVSALAEEVDRVVGFELGAADYVVKPFSVRELVLRIHAVLRRARSGPTVRGAQSPWQ